MFGVCLVMTFCMSSLSAETAWHCSRDDCHSLVFADAERRMRDCLLIASCISRVCASCVPGRGAGGCSSPSPVARQGRRSSCPARQECSLVCCSVVDACQPSLFVHSCFGGAQAKPWSLLLSAAGPVSAASRGLAVCAIKWEMVCVGRCGMESLAFKNTSQIKPETAKCT